MAISNIRWRFASMIALMYVMSAVSGFKLQVSNKTTTESVTMDADVNENAIQKYDLKSVIDFVHPKKAKIVGGQDVVYGEYPWQAGICKIYNNVTKPWCGASILNNYWVVSAAHCFESIKAHNLRVFVGDYDTESKDVGEEEFDVEKLIIHEKYRIVYVGYDIALLKIKPKKRTWYDIQ
uniref:Peptidase S1 domain-containing protein n=1 Tax=Arion vulgaris TaxID=1028688 RepID=A0A0B7AM64_9EUPU